MKTREQILEEFKKEIDEVSSKYWDKLNATSEPEQPTSTRLERLGFYNVGYLCPYFFLSDNKVEQGECILDTGVKMQDVRPANSFKTEQDAQAAAKRREIIADLWRNSKEFVENDDNYCIDYDIFSEKFLPYCANDCQTIGAMYFTEDKADEMIAKHGEDLKLLQV